MSNRPIIRFNGYQSEWQTEKFSSVFTPLKNNTLSRAELNDEEGNAKNVHYGDVLIKFGEYLDAEKEHIPFITSDELAEKLSSFALQNGDIIIADTAEDSTVGKCTEIGNIPEDVPVVSGLHTIPVRPNADFASGYLGYFMNSDAYHDQLLPLIQGTKVSSIAKTYLGETDIHFPSDVSEQEKISSFLRYLNDLIINQQQKYEKLVALKSACLDKMFPKIGCSTPEVRFRGFSGNWEVHKIGALMNVTSVKRIHQSDWTNSGVRFLRARDIVAAAKNEEPDEYLYISKEKYLEYSALSGKVQPGDLLVTGVGTIGVPFLVKDNDPLYFKDGNIIWFQNQNKINGEFLYYSFMNNRIVDFICEAAGVGTVGTYTIDSGKKTPIALPAKKEEQALIGSFFSLLDHLININKCNLETTKQFKRAMLHSMFA